MNPKRYDGEQRTPEEKKAPEDNRKGERIRKNGFYIALAVCLAAVGVAAWSTYDTVRDYVVPYGENKTSAAGSETSGTVDDDPGYRGRARSSSAVDAAAQPEASPEENSPAQNTEERSEAVTKPFGDSSEETQSIESSPESVSSQAVEDKTEKSEDEAEAANTSALFEKSTVPVYPVESDVILKAYSSGNPMYSKTMKDWRIHAGIDIEAESGANVRAMMNGQVKEVYTDDYLGNTVVINHGDCEIYYCGLGSDIPVEDGDIVSMGQTIGTVAAVPVEAADGEHIHIEVKSDGAYLDPMTVLSLAK